MTTMNKTSRSVTLSVALSASLLVLAACEDDPCAPADTIVPGVGVGLGDGALCLGQTAADVEVLLGAGAVTHDLGDVGKRVTYPTHKLAVLYSAAGGELAAVYLDEGATAKTAGGVGIGSASAAVKAALGAAEEGPYLQDWWYPSKGMVVQLSAGKVAAIQVMAPGAGK